MEVVVTVGVVSEGGMSNFRLLGMSEGGVTGDEWEILHWGREGTHFTRATASDFRISARRGVLLLFVAREKRHRAGV